jgi:hypothetical protein
MMTDRSETTLPSTAEFEAHFFRDAEKVKVEVELLSETVEAVHRLAAENEWEDAEGWRAVIGAGLGYLAQVESMYAVLKFRTFGFLKDNQTLEFHAAALRTSVKALEMTVDRLREENERLKAEIGLLRSRPDAPAAGVAAPPAEGNPSARQGWRWRIAHWLGVV